MTLEKRIHVVYRGYVIEKPSFEKLPKIEAHSKNRFFEKMIAGK